MNDEFITIDKIKWWIKTNNGVRTIIQPLCPTHGLRLNPIPDRYSNQYNFVNNSYTLRCEDCVTLYTVPRSYQREKQYVIDRLDAKVFKTMKFINLDDEALPLAEDKKSSKDNKFFVTSLLTKSKTGLRLIVYAGEKGKKEKTQIFVEPDIKRLAFDQKDLHPTEVFAKLEATFNDGTKSRMVNKKNNEGGDYK